MGTQDDDDEREEVGTKGNKKGLPIWSFVKNTSLVITICVFVLTSVLVLDAYKFVSVRHAKFARAKIFQTLQSMDPTIIESHTGMKVLTNEEYTQLQTNLDKSKSEARQINAQVQLKFSKLLETTTAVEKMKKDIEELKKAIEEKEKEAADAAKPEEKETKVADAASESVLEEKETKAADASKPVIDEKEKKAAGAVKATTDEKGAANNDNAKVAETKQ